MDISFLRRIHYICFIYIGSFSHCNFECQRSLRQDDGTVINGTCKDDIYGLEVNVHYMAVRVGDKPEFVCSTKQNPLFLITYPLQWVQIGREDNAKPRNISQLAAVTDDRRDEFSIQLGNNGSHMNFKLSVLQGIKRSYDGYFRCQIINGTEVLASKSVEIHVISTTTTIPNKASDAMTTTLQHTETATRTSSKATTTKIPNKGGDAMTTTLQHTETATRTSSKGMESAETIKQITQTSTRIPNRGTDSVRTSEKNTDTTTKISDRFTDLLKTSKQYTTSTTGIPIKGTDSPKTSGLNTGTTTRIPIKGTDSPKTSGLNTGTTTRIPIKGTDSPKTSGLNTEIIFNLDIVLCVACIGALLLL